MEAWRNTVTGMMPGGTRSPTVLRRPVRKLSDEEPEIIGPRAGISRTKSRNQSDEEPESPDEEPESSDLAFEDSESVLFEAGSDFFSEEGDFPLRA